MKKIFPLFAVIIVLVLAICSFHIIPTGYTGVKTLRICRKESLCAEFCIGDESWRWRDQGLVCTGRSNLPLFYEVFYLNELYEDYIREANDSLDTRVVPLREQLQHMRHIFA